MLIDDPTTLFTTDELQSLEQRITTFMSTPRPSDLNRPAILRVASLLAAPQAQVVNGVELFYDQSDFGSIYLNNEGGLAPECRTECCIAGYAMIDAGFAPKEVALLAPTPFQGSNGWNRSVADIAAHHFGFPSYMRCQVFGFANTWASPFNEQYIIAPREQRSAIAAEYLRAIANNEVNFDTKKEVPL
jgi:hypothetical protein